MGQLVTSPQRTEPIAYYRSVPVPDGQGGTTGNLQKVYDCKATAKPLKSTRTLEANQSQLKQGYLFGHWVDPKFQPQQNDVIVYRDKEFVLQQCNYQDATHQRWEIIGLEGSYQNGNGSQS